jgi:hypothetical protein
MRVLKIPPPEHLHDSREEYKHGEHTVIIDFYRTEEGAYIVWPYIQLERGTGWTARHFQHLGHFSSKEEARQSTLEKGRALIDNGFDVYQID